MIQHHRLRTFFHWLFIFSSSWASLWAQSPSSEITADELRAHVKYLASDELEGRAPGTEGNRKAADYIANQLRLYGLKPGGDKGTYMQEFEFVSSVRLGSNNMLTFEWQSEKSELVLDKDFRPFGFSSNTSVSGKVAFVGYGISAPEKNYDDYKDIDVTGKVAVALRYSPDGDDPHSDFYRYSAFRNKARRARDKGAAGLIIATGPLDADSDDLVKLSFDHAYASSGIPTISMKRAHLEKMLPPGMDLRSIQDSIRSSKKPLSFDLQDVTVTLGTEVEKVMSGTANVIGYLEGTDPKLKDQTVVIGAHLDHLGFGGPGSGSLQPDIHAIHNGADDNASGTAGLLELAQAFALEHSGIRRTLIFIAFSGEEMGTLGSGHYVNHPVFPLDRTIAMINMDMIGRLENTTLTVYGTGTSPQWSGLLGKHNADSTFTLKLVPDGFGPSDHAQFYGKDIPVLFFFTGTHSDYHKPTDDWEKLNYAGHETVVRFAYDIAKDIAARDEKPLFARTQSAQPMGGDSRGFTVTLGVIPDYGGAEEGMKIGGIRPGGPAEKCGLKAGDVIVSMAGKKVMNIYDYMGVLGELRPGDEVEVEAKRGGDTVKLTARMEKRQ